MLNSLPSLLLIPLLFCVAAAPTSQPADLRVMSFNVRNSNAMDGDNAWPHRKDLLLDTIKTFDPDLLGTQEVRPDQHDFLVEHLPAYTPVGVGRDDGKNAGEYSLILVRNARFTVEDSGTFWLSEHPDEPGSKSWDAALTRICSYALLKDKLTGRTLLYANTHFDHKGKEARLQSARLIREKVAALAKGAPIILTGDFNTTETDPPYHALTDDHQFLDSFRELNPTPAPDEASFHGFKGTTKGKRIDFILHTKEIEPLTGTIVRTHSADNHYPSDHYAVTATLRFKDK